MRFGKVDHWPGFRLPRWPCELCGAAAGSAGICGPCRAELPWIGAACQQCARPLGGEGHCNRCFGDTLPWTRAVAPLAWTFPVDALISRYKYGGALHFGALFGRLLADSCSGVRPDGVVPVPLHPARLAERGFNQAKELARPLARIVGAPVLERVCRRTVATPPQAGLTAQQRYRNLRNAFAASSEVRGLRLAVVDDVLTTGSTAAAVSRALLRAGAVEVEVWAVARGGTAQAGVKV